MGGVAFAGVRAVGWWGRGGVMVLIILVGECWNEGGGYQQTALYRLLHRPFHAVHLCVYGRERWPLCLPRYL